MARVAIRFAGEAADANRASESVERGLEGVSRQAVKTRAALSNVWGDRTQVDLMSKSIDGLNVGLGNTTNQTKLFSGSLGLIKWPAIYTGASFAAQGVGALGAGIVALTAAVAPAAAAVGAMPAALSTVAQATGTVKLALRGLEEAIKGDEEALAKLSPAARSLAGIVKGTLSPALEGLSRIASQKLFAPLLDEIQPLMETHLPRLQKIVGETAAALGRIGERLAQELRSPAWGKALDELGAMNVRVIENLGDAALAALPGVRDLSLAFAPLVEWVSRGVESFGRWLSAAVAANKANGDLDRSVSRVKETLSSLGEILGNLAKGFYEIFKAAAPLGREILADLEKVTAQFVAWTRSMEGQQTLKQYFADAKEPLYEVARLLRDVVGVFLRISTDDGFANLIRQIRTDLLPMLEQVIRTTTERFGPALVEMGVAIGKLFLTIAGSSGPLVAFVRGLADIANGIRKVLDEVPGLKQLAISLGGAVAILKVMNFAAAITGARTLAASMGLIAPAAARGAVGTNIALATVGATATAQTAAVGRLRAALLGLSSLKILVPILLGTQLYGPAKDFFEDKLGADFQGTTPGGGSNPTRRADGVWVGAQGPVDAASQKVWERRFQSGQVSAGGTWRRANTPAAPGSSADRLPSQTGAAAGPIRRGSVSGDIQGLDPGLLERLQALSAKTGRAIAVTSGFRTAGEQASLVASKGIYDPRTNPTGAAPVGSSNHETGMAADISPGREVFGGAAAAYGLAFPIPGEPWHVELAGVTSTLVPAPVGGGGAAAGAGAGAAVTQPTRAQTTLQKAIGGLQDRAMRLTDDIPEIAKQITPRLEQLYEQLGDGRLSEKALAGIRAAGEKIRAAIQNLIKGDELRDRIPNLRGTINSILDDESREGLQRRATQLEQLWRKIVKDGLSDKELATFKAATQKLNAAVNAAFTEDTLDRIRQMRGSLNELFAKGFIDEKSLEMARAALDRIPAMMKRFIANDGILGPEEKKKIRQQLSIAQEIIDAGNEAMREAEKAFGRVKKTFSELIRDGVISDADLAVLAKAVAGIGGKIGVGLQEAVDAVATGRQDFDRAWGEFRSTLERAFQEQVVGRFQLTIDFASMYEETRKGERELAAAAAAWNAVISGGMNEGAETVRAAVERVLAANAEYTAAIISQDRDRIKAAVEERLAANEALAALELEGGDERARAVLQAGQRIIAAEAANGARQVAEQKRIWEETKQAALAGVLAVVDEVGQKLRDGKITWAAAVREIGTALTTAGMDASGAADLLGQNVAGSMGKAAAAIETAVGRLTTAIQDLVRTMGGAVTDASGYVSEAQRLYDSLTRLGAGTDIEMTRIRNAAVTAGLAAAPPTSTSSPTGLLPTTTTPIPTPTPVVLAPEPVYRGGGGGRYLAMATGGIVERAFHGIARLAEEYPEAMIPLPPWMDPAERRYIVGMAEGGWRARTPGGAQRQQQPIMARAAAPAGELAASTGGRGGGTVVHAPVSVTVHHDGIITAHSDLGETIATVATDAIRDHLIRIGDHNPDIFGGRA